MPHLKEHQPFDKPLETPFEDPVRLALMASPLIRFGSPLLMKVLSSGILNAANVALQSRLVEKRPVTGGEAALSFLTGGLLGKFMSKPSITSKATKETKPISSRLPMKTTKALEPQSELFSITGRTASAKGFPDSLRMEFLGEVPEDKIRKLFPEFRLSFIHRKSLLDEAADKAAGRPVRKIVGIDFLDPKTATRKQLPDDVFQRFGLAGPFHRGISGIIRPETDPVSLSEILAKSLLKKPL